MTSVKVSVVTGGGGALGSAIAERIAERGDTVYLVDRDGAAAEDIAAKINAAGNGTAIAVKSDIASDAANRAFMARIHGEHGRLDRLINNAGIHQHSTFGDVRHEEWSRVLDVNLWAPASLCQAAVPIWQDRPGGSVVNLGSRSWLTGGPLAYVASKAGVVGLTHALAVELGRYDVTVNAVAPSTVPTPIVAAGRSPEDYQRHLEHVGRLPLLPRIATIEDVANAVLFLASAESGFVTGEVLHVAGGSQLAPTGS